MAGIARKISLSRRPWPSALCSAREQSKEGVIHGSRVSLLSLATAEHVSSDQGPASPIYRSVAYSRLGAERTPCGRREHTRGHTRGYTRGHTRGHTGGQ